MARAWRCDAGPRQVVDDTVGFGHWALLDSRSVTDKLDGQVELTDAEISERMSGNICRCSAYPNIVDAIRTASTKNNSGGPA